MKPIELLADAQGFFTPRPYQVDAVRATLEELNRVGATLMVLPTGCGKTVAFSEVALRWPGTAGRILVLAHRTELIEQAKEKIELHTQQPVSVEQAEQKDQKHIDGWFSQVVVGSVQTLCKPARLNRLDPMEFGLVVVDEAHHATSVTYRRIISYLKDANPELRVLGVTATPERADGVGLGWIFDSAAYRMELRDAIEEGWLVDIDQRYVRVGDLDFSAVHKVAGDLNEGELERAMLGGVVDPQSIEERKKQESMLHKVIAPTVELAAGRPTLVFCVTVAHAEKAASVAKLDYGMRAECIHGKTDKEKRKQIVAAFKAGDIDQLYGVGVFTEGFDAPNCAVIAMARPTLSKALYTQCLGRGTRPLPGVVDGPETSAERRRAIAESAKPRMVVLDFVGNSGRHKLVSAADILSGTQPEDVIAAAKKKLDKKGGSVRDALAEVRAERLKAEQEAEERKRARLVASAEYTEKRVNPFTGEAYTPKSVEAYKGGATEKQVKYLVSLGVNRETALAYSKRQAGAVIDSIVKRREKAKTASRPQGGITALPLDDINAELMMGR